MSSFIFFRSSVLTICHDLEPAAHGQTVNGRDERRDSHPPRDARSSGRRRKTFNVTRYTYHKIIRRIRPPESAYLLCPLSSRRAMPPDPHHN